MRILSRTIFFALVLALAAASGGCAALRKLHRSRGDRKKAPPVEAPARPLLVGTITLVNEDAHFVLIDVGFSSVPRTGMALKSMSGGVETGVVTVGDVRKRPFAVADIVSGAPKRGDQVFQ